MGRAILLRQLERGIEPVVEHAGTEPLQQAEADRERRQRSRAALRAGPWRRHLRPLLHTRLSRPRYFGGAPPWGGDQLARLLRPTGDIWAAAVEITSWSARSSAWRAALVSAMAVRTAAASNGSARSAVRTASWARRYAECAASSIAARARNSPRSFSASDGGSVAANRSMRSAALRLGSIAAGGCSHSWRTAVAPSTPRKNRLSASDTNSSTREARSPTAGADRIVITASSHRGQRVRLEQDQAQIRIGACRSSDDSRGGFF